MSSMYSPQVLDHFEHPRNAGEVPGADASVQVENPACGDVLRLSAKVVDGRLADVRFRAKGCVPSMACASLLTELVKGRTLQQARGLQRKQLLEAAGTLPPASLHASHLAMDALSALLKKLPAP
ncbi:MAG TPA: iron-sulfur cluster assembly scaffold protein [Terriglobales bacterium]|nr:iron-sulfur cluster assembly scaffold protein [Terriglobales bacterium]